MIGRADWKYLEGFRQTDEGHAFTNEFWFALDKDEDRPRCYALITTNEQTWAAWCRRHVSFLPTCRGWACFLRRLHDNSAPSYHGVESTIVKQSPNEIAGANPGLRARFSEKSQ